MMTGLRKDPFGRKSGKTGKASNKVGTKSSTKASSKAGRKVGSEPTLAAAMKLYTEFNIGRKRIKTKTRANSSAHDRANDSRSNYGDSARLPKGSAKDSMAASIGDSAVPDTKNLSFNRGYSSRAPYSIPNISPVIKVSSCPIKRSVASIELGLALNMPTPSTRSNNAGKRENRPSPPPPPLPQTPPQVSLAPLLQTDAPIRIPGTDIVISPITRKLVAEITHVFRAAKVRKMAVHQLLNKLCCNDSGRYNQWATYDKGSPMKARQLSSLLLKELGLHSFDLRVADKIMKGYHGAIFEILHVAFSFKTATN
jgi:hypothetical protein